MVKFDIIDNKILYHLSINSRQSLRQISRKVNLKKETVLYRIKRLVDYGIIKNYYSLIIPGMIGYYIIRFYYNFERVTPKIKNEIIDFFINYKYSNIIRLLEGKYDLEVQIYVRDGSQILKYNEIIKNKFGEYISSQVFSTSISTTYLDYLFLLGENNQNQNRYLMRLNEKIVYVVKNLDPVEEKLLRIIDTEARISITDLANRLNSTITILKNRIKKLEELGIIQNYLVNLDLSKMGYRRFHLDLDLRHYKEFKNILNVIEKNPYIVMIDRDLGLFDLSIHIFQKNINHLHKTIEEISLKFPDSIKKFQYHGVLKEYIHQLMPIPEKKYLL
jgi:Lrp/AsnC family leucine-responsive transcriptional regulator